MGVELREVARDYVHRYLPDREPDRTAYRLRWNPEFARRVADYFETAPYTVRDRRLAVRYTRFKAENLRQFRTVVAAGIAVRPWLESGQPYRDSTHLRAAVRADSELFVHLTSVAHGPGPGLIGHPMVEPSGIVVDGIELRHNDLFRAVHDLFGHVLSDSGFGPRGEFRAAFAHLGMYSAAVHPVVFTEQVAQICWYFFGPRAHERRYPPQKVFEFPPEYPAGFRALFAPPEYDETR
ncbi:crotonobetainyl-CoA--carnitine CoA-transferase [Nocardia panacis]|uniref:crotonobetainyl-CoA--carnitine CoA-transferase n=1 Tax=Nocardia panacis TaxID=2340916 RepID=UPI00193ABE55|nr:crotonobetainyl-CoA--carnitine CoA-transferase [Nocardia panacis]